MNNQLEIPSGGRNTNIQEKMTKKPFSEISETTRSIPSVLMSIPIAFFPKCPICWAVYMSMVGSLSLAQLPYAPWLLPVLLSFLASHLFMLFRKSSQNGYVPFALSLAGAVLILSGKFFFPLEKWLMIAAVAIIISGSLLNSFSNTRLQIINFKKHTI
jgi:hypothetical protein